MSTSAHERALEEALADIAPPRRRRAGGLLEWAVVLLVTAAVAAVVAALAILLAERELGRRIYPNISVRGVPVGGLTPDQARAAVERAHAEFLYSPVEIRFDGRVWRPSAEELGVSLMADEALAAAFALGREDTRANNLRRAYAVWRQGYDLPLRLRVDQAAMQRYLLGVAAAVEAPPTDADLWLEGPRVAVRPEAWGTQALVDETLADITAAVQGLARQPVALRTRTLEPRVRDAHVAPAAAELRLLLGAPVTLSGDAQACPRGCQWQISPDQVAPWVSVRRIAGSGGAPEFVVALDPAGVRSALLPIARALRREGTLPSVAWNGGDLRITAPGAPGRGLDADEALAVVGAALYSEGEYRSLTLPMTPLPPPVTEQNLAALGITEQVGLGVSSFARSEQYRITNIRAGARRMSGVLIPPGATFSFNEQLGEVNAENGFVEGLAIIDNRTQKEWGGGLCQVSTTVFRAAFFGGLPIAERHEHAFRIGWYEELGEPPGLDAAIFTPYNDMRFTNDSGGWLLMESYVDLERQRLSVALYGPPTGRQVTYDYRVVERTPAPTRPVYVDDPAHPRGYLRQSDTARGGISVEVYRTVTGAGQVLARDTFPTTFKPWPNIYVRGTG